LLNEHNLSLRDLYARYLFCGLKRGTLSISNAHRAHQSSAHVIGINVDGEY